MPSAPDPPAPPAAEPSLLYLTLDGDTGAGSVGGNLVGDLGGMTIHLRLTGDMTIGHAHEQVPPAYQWPAQREAEEWQHDDSGPSSQWKAAHDRSAPEPGAQSTLVSILSRPILSTDTPAQARRVADLQRLIDGLDPATAERLDRRLESSSDALGELFRLTMHHVTRRQLLARLDRVRHAAPPTTAVTPGGLAPPAPPPSGSAQPPPSGSGSGSGSGPGDTGPPPPTVVDPGPVWNIHIHDIQVPPIGTHHDDNWALRLLRQAEHALGAQASAAMSLLPTWLIGVAIDAAVDVILGAGGAKLDEIAGKAGERAAEAILREASGTEVINLDDLIHSNDFPAADLISRLGVWQAKFYGCAGKDLTEEQMFSRYLGDLYNLFTGWAATDSAAELLLKNKDVIAGKHAWPSGLRATTPGGVASWLRDNIGLLVPSDALPLLVSDGGKAYLTRRLSRAGKSVIDRLDIGSPAKLKRFVDDQIKRVGSFGIDCQDVRLLIEAASYIHGA